ncbi:MAG: putative porin, partial [Bacteroidota bacterium]
FIQDRWKEISNDFSIYQFPDAKNLQQFIKLGAEIQLLNGVLRNNQSLYNFIGHAEYRNRTKNQKWNITALGKLYMTGSNFGDYHAYINLQRLLSQKLGSLQVGFENVNRSPSYIFNTTSNFYLAPPQGFSKENIVHFFGSFFQPKLGVQLGADYYLMTNYLYFKNYFQPQQESSPFNVLRLSASKTFTFFKKIKWHAEVYVQQKTGAVELNLPLLYTRNRIAYEGKLGFKNLNIAIGTEIRYQTPYKADNYSPVMGKFFYQDSITIANYPQIDAFMHLRIRGFRLFLRFDNLNAAALGKNFVTPENPFPGVLMRFGIHWSFVN